MSALIFADGFESGFMNHWDNTTIAGDGQVILDSVRPLHGSYGLHSYVHGTTPTTQARGSIGKAFPAETTVHIRSFFYLQGSISNYRLTLLALYTNSGATTSPANLGVRNGNLLLTYYRDSTSTAREYPSTIPVSYGVWHTLEMAVTIGGLGVGRIRVWLDKDAGGESSPDIDTNVLPSPYSPVDNSPLVSMSYARVGAVFVDVSLTAHTVYADSVAISTGYIGNQLFPDEQPYGFGNNFPLPIPNTTTETPDYKDVSIFTCTCPSGKLTKLTILARVASAISPLRVRGIVYSVTAGNDPDQLLAMGTEVVIANTALAEVVLPFEDVFYPLIQPNVVNGTKYGLGLLVGEMSNRTMYWGVYPYDSGATPTGNSGSIHWNTDYLIDGAANPFGTHTNYLRGNMCIYASVMAATNNVTFRSNADDTSGNIIFYKPPSEGRGSVRSYAAGTQLKVRVPPYYPPPVLPTYVFQDSFEDGYAKDWTGVTKGTITYAAQEITSQDAISGLYSYRCITYAVANQTSTLLFKTIITTPTDIYVRCYLKLSDLQLMPTNTFLVLVRITNGFIELASAGVIRDATGIKWRISAIYPSVTQALTAEFVAEDVWNYFEFHLYKNATVGVIELFINDPATPKAVISPWNTLVYVPNRVQLGCVIKSSGLITSPRIGIDEVVFNDSKVGP